MDYQAEERRSQDAREADQFAQLAQILANAPEAVRSRVKGAPADAAALSALPILRKSDLLELQKPGDLLGGLAAHPVSGFRHIFMSPGPIFEPGGSGRDWFRLGRFLVACGIGRGDIVQNCFSYHLTPAGMMFENAAEAVGATILPAGVGQTELQAEAAAAVGTTAYSGTPDFLLKILEKADEKGLGLSITRAAVSGGALFPSLREEYEARGIITRQCYATADVGNIAYESEAMEGMIVDEGVLLEIVRPGTGDVVPAGEVGEVVVTILNADYPLIRFATGDLSAILPGESPCGRTGPRIKGWMGRADQATKVKGMFVRPEQVAELLKKLDLSKARLTVTRQGEEDALSIAFEAAGGDAETFAEATRDVLKLRAEVEIVSPGSLPNDGKVIEDRRSYE